MTPPPRKVVFPTFEPHPPRTDEERETEEMLREVLEEPSPSSLALEEATIRARNEIMAQEDEAIFKAIDSITIRDVLDE